jgi:hypothetical protein
LLLLQVHRHIYNDNDCPDRVPPKAPTAAAAAAAAVVVAAAARPYLR